MFKLLNFKIKSTFKYYYDSETATKKQLIIIVLFFFKLNEHFTNYLNKIVLIIKIWHILITKVQEKFAISKLKNKYN